MPTDHLNHRQHIFAPTPTHLSAAASIVRQSRYSVPAEYLTITGPLPSPLDTHSNNRHTTPNKIASRLGSIPMSDRSRSDVSRPPAPSRVVSQIKGRTQALRPHGAQVAPSWSSRRAALPGPVCRRGGISAPPISRTRQPPSVLSARCQEGSTAITYRHIEVQARYRPGAAQRAPPDMVGGFPSSDQTPVAHRPFSVEALAPFSTLVSALHEGMLVRAVHVVSVTHKISHCFIELYNAAMVTVHDNSHTLGHAPNWQIGIKRHVPVASRLHEKHKTVVIIVLDRLQVSQNGHPINLLAPHQSPSSHLHVSPGPVEMK